MAPRQIGLVFALLLVLLAAGFSMFTVNETQFAIRKRFGAIVATELPPGLHYKWPWDTVTKFDRRIRTQSYTGETFLTSEGTNLIVDFYVKWRVKDPARFYTTTGGVMEQASNRLGYIVNGRIKTVVAQQPLGKIIAAERAAVTSQMFGRASEDASALGMNLIDVRVQRIDLPDEVAARVYESMKQSFAKIANSRRAEGQKESATIRADAERQRTVIIAEAERDALRLRGEGDALAAQTYAHAYARDPEFFAFYRSMQAYERSLGKDGDLLVVTPDGEFFRYLRDAAKAPAPARR